MNFYICRQTNRKCGCGAPRWQEEEEEQCGSSEEERSQRIGGAQVQEEGRRQVHNIEMYLFSC